MTKFMRQFYAVRDAGAAVRAASAGKAPLEDINGYLTGLEIELGLKDNYACSFPVFILCYALELEHQRNAKLRKKLHELKQARRAEVARLERENVILWAERTNAQFMDMLKGGVCHGRDKQSQKES